MCIATSCFSVSDVFFHFCLWMVRLELSFCPVPSFGLLLPPPPQSENNPLSVVAMTLRSLFRVDIIMTVRAKLWSTLQLFFLICVFSNVSPD